MGGDQTIFFFLAFRKEPDKFQEFDHIFTEWWPEFATGKRIDSHAHLQFCSENQC